MDMHSCHASELPIMNFVPVELEITKTEFALYKLWTLK